MSETETRRMAGVLKILYAVKTRSGNIAPYGKTTYGEKVSLFTEPADAAAHALPDDRVKRVYVCENDPRIHCEELLRLRQQCGSGSIGERVEGVAILTCKRCAAEYQYMGAPPFPVCGECLRIIIDAIYPLEDK